jgi:hypothetical protein
MIGRRQRRILGYGLAGVCALLMSAVFAPPAAAAPDAHAAADRPGNPGAPAGATKTQLRREATAKIPLKVRRDGGIGVQVDDTPPLGGCALDIGISIQAWYLEHILVRTDAYYSDNVTCTTTAPGQTMMRITNIAKLYYYNQMVSEGNLAECQHILVTDPPCTGAWSGGLHQCWGQFNCAGPYQAMGYVTLVLPRGWAWSGPAPEDCWYSTPQILNCIQHTKVLTVPPTN